ncbi:MAG: hypothetical protein RJA70_4058 [Pseudomonadota bacterium]|jgi:hypothetical protein
MFTPVNMLFSLETSRRVKSLVSQRFVLVTCAGLISASVPQAAQARQTGTDIDTCIGCHEHGYIKDAVVTVDSHQIQPGGTANFKLVVKSAEMLSGFLAKADAGQLEIVDPEFQRKHEKPGIITHVKPKPFVNGTATWEFSWTAPLDVGITVFKVSSVAANGNMVPGDDIAAILQTWVAYGCEGAEYFPDLDLDGFGDAERTSVPSCEPVPKLVPNGLDCEDGDPVRNPNAVELCNFKDDNCDGKIDEGLNTAALYPDLDGDGHGAVSGSTSEIGCPPVVGWATTFDDCDDENATASPSSPEICNGIDDDCNRKIDDACVAPPGGVPSSGGAGGEPPAMVAGAGGEPGLVPLPPDESGGCRVSSPSDRTQRSGGVALVGLALALCVARRRR